MCEVTVILPHAHVCPRCGEEFDCFCEAPQAATLCPDCWLARTREETPQDTP